MKSVPVTIIGGGSVGLATALDLALRGIRSVVVEQREGERPLQAKASALNERSLEICRWWGIRDAVTHCGVPDDVNMDTLYCTSLAGRFIGVDHLPSARDRIPPPGSLEKWTKIPQYKFDAILEEAVARTGMVEVLRGHRCVDVSQDGQHVTATLVSGRLREPMHIRSAYLVACDGAGSGIRERLGLGFEGPLLSYSAGIMLKADLEGTPFGRRNRFMFIDETGTWANLTAVDLQRIWRLTLVGDQSKMDRANHDVEADVRRAFGPDIPFEILDVSYWQRSQKIIEKYRVGRILFAGDSAHTTSPTGALGLNTGVGDALSVGWMLHAVLSGYGGEGLLDAYEVERRPVAIRNSTASSENFAAWKEGPGFRGVLKAGPEGDRVRRDIAHAMRIQLRQEWVSQGAALGYRYEGSPIIVADGTPEPPNPIDEYLPTTRPGHRAPHAVLADGTSTIDQFGRDFVLLTQDTESAGPFFEALMQERSIPARVVPIDSEELAAVYETAAVLVRPDGHVAWRGDHPLEDLPAVLDTIIGWTAQHSDSADHPAAFEPVATDRLMTATKH